MIDLQLFFLFLCTSIIVTELGFFALPAFNSPSETRMHPVVECFHKCEQASEEEPEIQERQSRLIREYFLGTSERCRGLTCVERMLVYFEMFCQGSITPCTRFVDLTGTLGQETNIDLSNQSKNPKPILCAHGRFSSLDKQPSPVAVVST